MSSALFLTIVVTSQTHHSTRWLLIALACVLCLALSIPVALGLEALRNRRARADKSKQTGRELEDV